MALLDGYGWLLAISVALAGLTFYLGFLSRQPDPGSPGYLFWAFIRGRNIGGSIFVVAVLVPISAWLVWQAGRVEAHVSELITPYPNASQPIVVPDVDGDPNARQYLVTTGDPAELVIAFYAEPVNHAGWEMVESTAALIHLERAGQALFLVATENLTGTTIAYLVRDG